MDTSTPLLIFELFWVSLPGEYLGVNVSCYVLSYIKCVGVIIAPGCDVLTHPLNNFSRILFRYMGTYINLHMFLISCFLKSKCLGLDIY